MPSPLDLIAFRARKREIDSMVAMAEVKRTDGSGTDSLAMQASAYHFQDEDETSRPVALAQTETTPVRSKSRTQLRPALSSTRGTR